jgi:N-glycosylase/DNA lyase
MLLSPDQPTLLWLPPDEPFDLEQTFRCGQVFRWRQHGDTWYGPHGAAALAFRRVTSGVEARAIGRVTAEEAARFLRLHHSLLRLYAELEFDPSVTRAIGAVPGLRIIGQDPWDCVAGYVCSQWNNIPKIELSTERIARAWGEVHVWPEGVEVASLPSPTVLGNVPVESLKECALGYRCRYLVETARRIGEGEVDLGAVRDLPYEDALTALLALPGIGRKVADCILLFGLGRPTAVPVDVWVRRVIHELYPAELAAYLPDAALRREKGLSGKEYEAIRRFALDRWGRNAGYAQQYLFHARRLGLIGPAPDCTATT